MGCGFDKAMLTWVRIWERGCPRWVRRRLTRAAWAALPHVTWVGIAAGCGAVPWLLPPLAPDWTPRVETPAQSVPEPGSGLILLAGVAALWRVRR